MQNVKSASKRTAAKGAVDGGAEDDFGSIKQVFDGKGKLQGGFGEGGGIGARPAGAGFGSGGWDKETGKWRGSTGDQKRSQRSKSRDKGKNHRRDK